MTPTVVVAGSPLATWLPRAAGLVLGLLLLGGPPAARGQAAYYVSPDGGGRNAAASRAQPLGSLAQAIGRLAPGDTLVLLDGTYTPATTGRLAVDGLAGTAEAPIVIRARNERQAHVTSDGVLPPIDLRNSRHLVVEGLQASSQDHPDGRIGEVVWVEQSEHVVLRRLLAHRTNHHDNASGINIHESQHVLVEETELYDFHRNGVVAFRSSDVTFRRSYANARDYVDDGGDSAFKGYYANHFLVENCISEGGTHGFSASSGRVIGPTGAPSGQHLRYLGNISLNDERSGAMDSRDKDEGGPQPIRDVYYENHLAIGSRQRAFLSRALSDLTMENVTVVGGQKQGGKSGSAFAVNVEPQHEIGPDRYQWFSCETGGGCRFRLRNWLVAGMEGTVFHGLPPNDAHLDFKAEYLNFYETAGLGLDAGAAEREGQVQHATQKRPTGIGTGPGECLVYVPEDSPMHGAGKNGADLGATLLYRYEDGTLTDEPLWDPRTGAFPHGAVVEGVNDVAGASAFDVHQRLHVNTEGCPLPYAERR